MELHGLMAKHGAAAPVSEAGVAAPTATPPGALAGLPLHKQLLHRVFLRPFLVMNVFFFIMQFSGVNAVAFYTVRFESLPSPSPIVLVSVDSVLYE